MFFMYLYWYNFFKDIERVEIVYDFDELVYVWFCVNILCWIEKKDDVFFKFELLYIFIKMYKFYEILIKFF